MQEKSSAMSTQCHPRIPHERDAIQVNHCKLPGFTNYGVAAAQSSVPGSNSYILDSRNKGISSCICSSYGVKFPLKSILDILEKVERMSSYLLPSNAVCRRNEACANHTNQVPIGTKGAYASFGKTAIGNCRWRCSVCSKTLSQNTKSTVRQREHHKNKTIFKLLVNKMPVRRIIEVANIPPKTFYQRLDFLHRQCQVFAAHRERALASHPIRRLYLGVDRQDYLANWLVHKDKRNIQLSAITTIDNEHGYCFGMHLNFDPSLDGEVVQAEVEANGDLGMPYRHRRFVRLWLNADHDLASKKSMATNRRKVGLPTQIDEAYEAALQRDDIESPDEPSPGQRLAEYGMQTHGEYTMYGHFFFLECLLGNVKKWRLFIDQDPGLRAACLSAFHDEIRSRTADVFYVRITKDMTVDEKRHRHNDAKTLFEQAKVAHPGMKPQKSKLMLIKERLALMTPYRKWQDHPFPTMSEPEKAVAHLTDLNDYEEDHKAWLYNKASLHGVDSYFNQVRRRLSLLERPIHSKSNKGRIWNGYSPYNPGNLTKVLNIMRTGHRHILTGKVGKTPVERLGLPKAPLDYEDIIYFTSTD
ncbi:MAG: transposase-like protein [Lentisphaeria bacterium]|jgi:transposase-like protein